MISIIVNGQPQVLSQPCNLEQALLALGYQPEMSFAVAVNQRVIPKQQHADYLLVAGCEIEILMPMQGG